MKRESGYWASGDTVGALTGAGDGPAAFPMSIEYMFEDAVLGLRPNLTLAKTLEEAVSAVDQLEAKLIAQLPKPAVSKNYHVYLLTLLVFRAIVYLTFILLFSFRMCKIVENLEPSPRTLRKKQMVKKTALIQVVLAVL